MTCSTPSPASPSPRYADARSDSAPASPSTATSPSRPTPPCSDSTNWPQVSPLVVLTYLYHHVHPKTADDLVLTGRRLGAAEALSLGLISRVVPEADLDTTVARTVGELSGRDPPRCACSRSSHGRPSPGNPVPPRSSASTPSSDSCAGSSTRGSRDHAPNPPSAPGQEAPATTEISSRAPADRPPSARRQRRAAFASAWLGWMLDGFETYSVVLVGGLVVADLVGPHASPMYFSVVLAVQLVAWAVGGLASGVLIDYFGRRQVLMGSILLYSVATGLAALAPNFWLFLILRVLAGLGMGAEWGPGSALVAESWPARSRGWGVAVLQSAFGIGFLLATGVFQLLDDTGPNVWRWMLLLGAAPALLVLLIRRTVGESELWRVTDERRARRPGEPATANSSARRSGR
ncbi:MFS transporter [Streptomyces sp. M19]